MESSLKMWLEIRIVMPRSRFRRKRSSRISTMPCGSSPLVGSSRMMKSGLLTSAIAMPSRWRMPSEKLRAVLLPVSLNPTKCNTSSITSYEVTPMTRHCSYRFCRAVILGYTDGVSMMAPVRLRLRLILRSLSSMPNRR